MSNEIDYESAVLKVYPDAVLLDNETEIHYANIEWISDGHGNDIGHECTWLGNPWRSAYEQLKQQGKI